MVMSNLGAPLRVGAADGKGTARGQGAGGLTTPMYVYQITPVTADDNGISTTQTPGGAGNLTITGALASGGVATFDVPRNVVAVSASGTDSTQTLTYTGTDYLGVPLVETVTLTGTTTVQGLKAFLTVSRVAVSAATVGAVIVGSGDKFGLPYRVNDNGYAQFRWDATWNNGSATFVAAVTSTATATTGDVRGTYLPATASDGTRKLTAWIAEQDVDSNNGLYGVNQYGG